MQGAGRGARGAGFKRHRRSETRFETQGLGIGAREIDDQFEYS